MAKRTITVSSRALGPRLHVTVYVYDTVDEMRTAAAKYNHSDQADTIGVTQARTDHKGRACTVLVRLARTHLGTRVVVHELHHAATALYGANLPKGTRLRDVLHHHNEPFAHLYSDLTHRLVDRLYTLGYYETR